MKKVVVASLLAVASVALVSRIAVAQTQVNLGSNAQASPSAGIQMSPAEYKAYNDAIGQTTPQTKAPALESYLTAYPQSAVKADVLQQLMLSYVAFDHAKAIDAADRLLQVDPNNLRALTFEVYLRKEAADQQTDAAAKQAGLDKAAEYAQKGLVVTKPKDMSDADFNTVKTAATPVFYSAIGTAALNKKDTATAIDAFKKELTSVPVDQTTKPGPVLQDTYFLGLAYLQSTPPDLVNCAFYVSRFVAFAPEPYKSQMAPTAKYCYKKYHGADDGYDAVLTAAQANLNPPAGFTIKPAPSPSDIVAQVIANTPDLASLAVSDKEFILQNGKPDDAAKVWDTIKGKSVQLPNVTVVSATDTAIQASVSDDAVQSKTADFIFNFKEPLKTVPAVGSQVTLSGTYDSYTVGGVVKSAPAAGAADAAAAAPAATPAPATPAPATPAPAATASGPVMIIMSDSAVVEPKKAPVKKAAPTRRAPARRR
jgi:tetratricopeptide (TPR) repeat protein